MRKVYVAYAEMDKPAILYIKHPEESKDVAMNKIIDGARKTWPSATKVNVVDVGDFLNELGYTFEIKPLKNPLGIIPSNS